MTRSRAPRGWLLALVWLVLLALPAFSGASAQTSQDNRTDKESTARSADEDENRDEATSEEEQRDSKQEVAAAKAAGHKGKVIEASTRNVSPLVKAAAASSSKKKGVRKFTDADLAGAKGKLIIVEGTNVREPEIIPIEERSPEVVRPATNDHMEQASQVQRQARAKALRKEIAELESEIRLLEEDYYLIEEEDHREVIERSFAEKRRSLNEKRKQLNELESGGSS